jgi:hypothetical protein
VTAVTLAWLVIAFIALLFVLDVLGRLLFGRDTDLDAAARGGWHHETTCGRSGCRSHVR